MKMSAHFLRFCICITLVHRIDSNSDTGDFMQIYTNKNNTFFIIGDPDESRRYDFAPKSTFRYDSTMNCMEKWHNITSTKRVNYCNYAYQSEIHTQRVLRYVGNDLISRLAMKSMPLLRAMSIVVQATFPGSSVIIKLQRPRCRPANRALECIVEIFLLEIRRHLKPLDDPSCFVQNLNG